MRNIFCGKARGTGLTNEGKSVDIHYQVPKVKCHPIHLATAIRIEKRKM
jgi:hypothetical protein